MAELESGKHETAVETEEPKATTDELAKSPGFYSPPPPCCAESCTTCRAYGEDSDCCVTCGKIGLSGSDGEIDMCNISVPRHKLMYSAFGVSVMGLIFMIVAACAVSTDPVVVKNTCWSTGSPTDDVSVYVGLSGVAYQYTGDDDLIDDDLKFLDWDEYECVGDDDCDGKTCADAASALVTMAILGAVTQLGQLTTDLQRSTVAGDLNCQKTMGIVTGIFGLVSTLYSLTGFTASCWHVSDKMTVGPGLVLIVLGNVVKLYDVACHAILPTPPHRHGGGLASSPINSA